MAETDQSDASVNINPSISQTRAREDEAKFDASHGQRSRDEIRAHIQTDQGVAEGNGKAEIASETPAQSCENSRKRKMHHDDEIEINGESSSQNQITEKRKRIVPVMAIASVQKLSRQVDEICRKLQGLDPAAHDLSLLIAHRMENQNLDLVVSQRASAIIWAAGILHGERKHDMKVRVSKAACCSLSSTYNTYGIMRDDLVEFIATECQFGSEEELKQKLPLFRREERLNFNVMDHVDGICGSLGLDGSQIHSTARMLTKRIEELNLGGNNGRNKRWKSPFCLPGALVWISGLLYGKRNFIFKEQVSRKARCDRKKITNVYHDLYDVFVTMIAREGKFGNEEELKRKLPKRRPSEEDRSVVEHLGEICESVGVDGQSEIRVFAEFLAKRIENRLNLDDQHSSLSKAATLVWIVGILHGKGNLPFMKAVKQAANTTRHTMQKNYVIMYDRLLPAIASEGKFGDLSTLQTSTLPPRYKFGGRKTEYEDS